MPEIVMGNAYTSNEKDAITEDNGRKLRQLALAEHPSVLLAFVIQVHCPSSKDEGNGRAGGVTVVDHVKMFRNHPELRFEFRIHEQVLPSINRLGGKVAWTDIFAERSGADHTSEGRQRK